MSTSGAWHADRISCNLRKSPKSRAFTIDNFNENKCHTHSRVKRIWNKREKRKIILFAYSCVYVIIRLEIHGSQNVICSVRWPRSINVFIFLWFFFHMAPRRVLDERDVVVAHRMWFFFAMPPFTHVRTHVVRKDKRETVNRFCMRRNFFVHFLKLSNCLLLLNNDIILSTVSDSICFF